MEWSANVNYSIEMEMQRACRRLNVPHKGLVKREQAANVVNGQSVAVPRVLKEAQTAISSAA